MRYILLFIALFSTFVGLLAQSDTSLSTCHFLLLDRTTQVPVGNAFLIATPVDTTGNVVFNKSSTTGSATLQLNARSGYRIVVTHISYQTDTLLFKSDQVATDSVFTIWLTTKDNQLPAFDFREDTAPISVCGDTVIYKADAFVSDEKQRLRALVANLPGVVLDGDDIYFQGKKVDRVLVENEVFFGGGSGLALDNIPAAAIEDLAFIDQYQSESALIGLRHSDQLALDIRLKADYKQSYLVRSKGAARLPISTGRTAPPSGIVDATRPR